MKPTIIKNPPGAMVEHYRKSHGGRLPNEPEPEPFSARLQQDYIALKEADDGLHTAVCQAVGKMNLGHMTEAHDILRKALIAYADAPLPQSGTSK